MFLRLPRQLSRPSSLKRALATQIELPRAEGMSGPFIGNKMGGKYTVTLIPGDGIGQEITMSVKTIFRAAEAPILWEQFDLTGYTETSDALFNQSLESLKRNGVGLKGILYTPLSRYSHTSFNVGLRKELDMFASLSVCKNFEGINARHTGIDIAIIRENTEGEYAGLEHQSYPGVVESMKVITRKKSERIARFAFDFALKNRRKRVTCVHKANIMKLSDGLFLETFRRVAQEYASTDIQFNDMIVDNTSMQLVSRPQQFDVMVTPNLYGTIVCNIAAALIGGPGLVPGFNMGRDYALFEPGCRHVAKDIQGKNMANPTAMIFSSVMMLRHLSLNQHANRIETALLKTLKEGSVRTPDLGGNHTTTDFTLAVISNL